MKGIAAALTGTATPTDTIDYETLRHAVQRAITCPRTGAVLDVRSAVLFTVTAATPTPARGSQCVTAAAWDAIAKRVTAACERPGVTLEVVDGRTFTARGTRRKTPTPTPGDTP